MYTLNLMFLFWLFIWFRFNVELQKIAHETYPRLARNWLLQHMVFGNLGTPKTTSLDQIEMAASSIGKKRLYQHQHQKIVEYRAAPDNNLKILEDMWNKKPGQNSKQVKVYKRN